MQLVILNIFFFGEDSFLARLSRRHDVDSFFTTPPINAYALGR